MHAPQRTYLPAGPVARRRIEIVESLPVCPFTADCQTLAELLLRGRGAGDSGTPILSGTAGAAAVEITARQLRGTVLDLTDVLAGKGLRRGTTVCLLRLPRTSELLLAVTYASLTVMGVRVLLPMFTERSSLANWIGSTGTSAVIWAPTEARREGSQADGLRLDQVERDVAALGIPSLCLDKDLAVAARLGKSEAGSDDPRSQKLLDESDSRDECLILTTSGTNGKPKLVRYRQEAFLLSCGSWQGAGLFDPDRQGGRGLCLLFSHSMGVRAFWNAIWTGQPLSLIPPEWVLEHPQRIPALLRRMQPEHITGGPGVYWTLLELMRVFPDLKKDGLAHLRCAISIGAPFDERLARRLKECLGVELHNAFGTTETMQVFSTAIAGSGAPPLLGVPLPGVRVALEPLAGAEGTYRLLVHSPFGHAGYIDADAPADWYTTGDLVQRDENGLRYAGRENDDVAKDAFGVKISRTLLAERYISLGEPVIHVECFPMRKEPGLGAVIFVDHGIDQPRHPPLTDCGVLDRVRGLIEARHEMFLAALDDFELRHFTIARFACISGQPPRTLKGTVARFAIETDHASLLDSLLDRYVKHPGIGRVDRASLLESRSTRFVRPRLGKLLHLLRLDKEYFAGHGDRLEFRDKGVDGEVVDFVGGFGTNLLGHNHPGIRDAAMRFLEGGSIATADQGSDRPAEGALARRISEAIAREVGGCYIVRFGSSGSEAIEIALTHAYFEREERLRRFLRDQRRLFGGVRPAFVEEICSASARALHAAPAIVLTIAGSYHGTTIGARAVSQLRRSRPIFDGLTQQIEAVPLPVDGNIDLEEIIRGAELTVPALAWRDGELVETQARFSRIIAALAEPVRGEGGVTVVNPALLARLAAYDFPLIVDEIQCGLGRTGRFLASDGVRAGYYLFGKALGGAVTKISAVAIDRARYVERFDEHSSSTFAGDGLSCAIATKVLDIIEVDDVPARARERGLALRHCLDAIAGQFPTVVRKVDGKGLMLGVELSPAVVADSALLRAMHQREHLGLLASSYLLNRWNVRVLPSLSAPNTLRIEPSAYVDDAAIGSLDRGLRAFCTAIAWGDLAAVFKVLAGDESTLADPEPDLPLPPFCGRIEPPADAAVRVAFLNHFVHPERELALIERSLGTLPRAVRGALFERLAGLTDLKPATLFARNLFDGRIWFASIILPIDSASLEEIHRSGRREFVVQRIQESVDYARRLGCTVVGLGAYTSILTDNGTTLLPPAGLALCTGNTLTAAVGVRRVRRLCQRAGIDGRARSTRLGIVGASGNIGAALAWQLTHGDSPFHHVVLVGRREGALIAQAEALRRDTGCEVEWSCTLSALRECNVIVVATGTNEPLLYPRHIRHSGPVIVADLSVPSILAPETRALRNVRLVSLAGNIAVNGTPDFVMASHIPTGTAFSCAGEAMLLGLAANETAGLDLRGSIRPENMNVLERLAERFGMLGAARRPPQGGAVK